ncbi:MAG: serine/threonine protein kinase [Verrucomicrobia bacterium]|nr:serine/threonine protein kinase [Verrucomicrobiota bacterium]
MNDTTDPVPEVPDHRLLRVIRRGSYGEVWLARCALDQARAVKVVRRAFFDDDRPYDREWEGILQYEPVSRRHGHLIPILHVGRNDAAGFFYYVMELADDAAGAGEAPPEAYQPHTLKGEIERCAPLPPKEIVGLITPLLEALAFLHAHGLVHRDIKPSNVLYLDGKPCLADPGLVAASDATMSLVGTLGYMPPEGPGRPAGDMYSLGIVLYELLTGHDRQSFPALPKPLAATDRDGRIAGLNQIILKACDNRPGRRYANAADCLADVRRVAGGRRPAYVRRARLQRLAITGAILLLAAWGWHRSEEAVPVAADTGQWDFVYSYTHAHATNALEHVVGRENVQPFTEWQRPPVTYWAPITNGAVAKLTYRFDFPKPTREVDLQAQCEAWNFEAEPGSEAKAKGAFAIVASVDGTNWVDLINRLEPEPVWGGLSSEVHSIDYQSRLPAELTGARQLWVQVRMLCEGVPADPGFYPVQHSRIEDSSANSAANEEFIVRARY